MAPAVKRKILTDFFRLRSIPIHCIVVYFERSATPWRFEKGEPTF